MKFRGEQMELHRRRGALKGNRNRLKDGRYSAAALAQRKLVRETIRSARLVLAQAVAELQFDRARYLRDTAAMEKRG
jgi:hypothetical protein